LRGVILSRLGDNEQIDIGKALTATTPTTTTNENTRYVNNTKTMLILGTHPSDFNTIEYAQQVRAYWTQLPEFGIGRVMMTINGSTASCTKLITMLDLPKELEVFADPTGIAGRKFGVDEGFCPDDNLIPTALKVTVVGLGFGPPWGTLPAVLSGYFGNPNRNRYWIEESLKQGQIAGRWPNVLELNPNTNEIIGNKFDNFPFLSGWGLRPFELATLRLQNILSIQIKHWNELKPIDDRCLTQLGGCTIVGPGGKPLYSWIDRGLCDVPNIKDVLSSI